MARPDDVRIQHMVEAARKAIEFAAGRARDDLDTDEMLRLALVKLVESARPPSRCRTRRGLGYRRGEESCVHELAILHGDAHPSLLPRVEPRDEHRRAIPASMSEGRDTVSTR